MKWWLLSLALCTAVHSAPKVLVGADRLFDEEYAPLIRGKRVGLITNHTGIDSHGRSVIDVFKHHAAECELAALFGPEHGIDGATLAGDAVNHAYDSDGIPIYSLYGETRRPTEVMLEGLDVLVFDIQDIGTRCYTYCSTLFYVMEEAAKLKIPVVVLDRPNPMGGVIVDGPMMEEEWRSFVGYINIPFCHGMTIGELARYFNGEYQVGCHLQVVEMAGWDREMSFQETGLSWVPTSPHIPDADAPFYYPSTVILGEALTGVSVGVGTTLPFKVIGSPWIDGKKLAAKLNAQNFKGVTFQPWTFRPFFGRFQGETCRGVRIIVTDSREYRPVATQFLVLGILKSLYPDQFAQGVEASNGKKRFFCKIAGSEQIYHIVRDKKYIAWDLIGFHDAERKAYLVKRDKYLLY